jgi:hypothetical protein
MSSEKEPAKKKKKKGRKKKEMKREENVERKKIKFFKIYISILVTLAVSRYVFKMKLLHPYP